MNTKREVINKLVQEGKATSEIIKITGYSKHTVRYYREPSKDKNRKSIIERISAQRRKVKRKLIDYSGGKCLKCGYDNTDAALVFHHIDSKQKEFQIGNGSTKSFDKTKTECDKCCLLCHNCHVELHAGYWCLDNGLILEQNRLRSLYIDKPLSDYND